VLAFLAITGTSSTTSFPRISFEVIIHKYLARTFTLADVDEAEAFAINHGEPFYREGWLHILGRCGGRLPVRIRAIPEGLNVPVHHAILTIESARDPKCFWITNWLETMLSRVWYPSTIATTSREVKKVWRHYLELSSDAPDLEIGFKHHDFGSRGVTCQEQAMLGGAAHLLSFLGSDTVAGVMCANHYYDCAMSGFSIPATEHSTMTVFGREGEYDAVKRWIGKTLVERQVPAGVPKLTACVGDSYDIYNFVRMVCSDELREMVKNSGGTLVVRPDSGSPFEVLPALLRIFEECLPAGAVTVNGKGFKVLPAYFRIIWGDGINRRSMKEILRALTGAGWSASNLAFGSGGGLLQDVNRDTQKFAFKCSYAEVDGRSVDVRKDPITDPGKRSKAGRLDLIRSADGSYRTVVLDPGSIAHPDSAMVTVFENGDITHHTTLEECRTRMAV
jgi:nicotinamide phosphoribosyltransferase